MASCRELREVELCITDSSLSSVCQVVSEQRSAGVMGGAGYGVRELLLWTTAG